MARKYTRGKKRKTRRTRRKSWKSLNKRVSGWVNRELKYYDVYWQTAVPRTAADAHTTDPGTQLCLFAPIQGSKQNERDGNLATVYDVHIKGRIQFSTSVASVVPASTQHIRIMLVLDKQTNATQATGYDVLELPPTSHDISAFLRLENSARFTILSDRSIVPSNSSMSQNGTANYSSMAVEVPFSIYHRFNLGLKTRFLTNSGTVGDIKDMSLHLFAMAVPGTNTQLIVQSRCRFAG